MNWVDYKHSVNSVDSQEDNTEPSHRIAREGVETGHGATQLFSCSKCGEEKPESEFYSKNKAHKRRDNTCKACRITMQRERLLGITSDEYWSLYRKQEGKCGICERRLYSKRYKAFSVDHNHATGEIRGLLCHNCNRALGMFRDCPDALRRAAEWVEGTVRTPEQSG